MLDVEQYGYKRDEPAHPVGSGRFGEFDGTGIGTDLTLEWDSSDPDLHAHQPETEQVYQRVKSGVEDVEDYYRYFRMAGLPDA